MVFMIPDAVATHFHVRFGDRVADLGAGVGHFTKVVSRMVGPEGRVYAVEIQRPLAEAIAEMARKERLSNVESLWGDLEKVGGTKIAEGSLDAALLSNTLSMVEDKQTALAEAKRILRKGGKLLIVDWSDGGGLGPPGTMVVSEQEAKKLGEEAGFVYERPFPAGEHHYGLAFRKQ